MNPITLKLQAEPLVRMALQEDITSEDVSTASVMPHPARGQVHLIAKQDGVICGLDVFALAFELLDPTAEVHATVAEGDEVTGGQELAVVEADVRALLSAERVALNYLQRMSGIATYTRHMAALFAGTRTRLVDTRKTTPNMRVFEKEAVRVGGAGNHRYNLSDGVMLKDNHIDAAGGITQAVAAARAHAPFVRKVEVEVENLDMVREAVEAGADIIMLDNMDHETMRQAMAIIDGRAEVEVSGNVTAQNAAALVDLGVDIVSSGALTHSAPILDLSLKHLRVLEEGER
ncbi:MAG: carboxylating nicotinate-nucleotide diphosphorylase [Atopobiaceae bacterium]|nr:carboxylating nicotinate-nucleotide diphosphorylase [Atopobiaceae bacterium]